MIAPETFSAAATHDVIEYDGAFRCLRCRAKWGALPGNPEMPKKCELPATTRLREISQHLVNLADQYGHPDWSAAEFLEAIKNAASSIEVYARRLERELTAFRVAAQVLAERSERFDLKLVEVQQEISRLRASKRSVDEALNL